jgi:hypothetical protein
MICNVVKISRRFITSEQKAGSGHMSFWSAILRIKNNAMGHRNGSNAGAVKDEDGWHYEESRDFSKSQSTVRIDQRRPGEWEVLKSSCGVAGLSDSARRVDVARFFAGSYRWLKLEGGIDHRQGEKFVKVIGTFRDKKGKESAAHLGFLDQELVEDLKGEKTRNLWGKIRFIKFPTSGRNSGYLIRFDLMKKRDR